MMHHGISTTSALRRDGVSPLGTGARSRSGSLKLCIEFRGKDAYHTLARLHIFFVALKIINSQKVLWLHRRKSLVARGDPPPCRGAFPAALRPPYFRHSPLPLSFSPLHCKSIEQLYLSIVLPSFLLMPHRKGRKKCASFNHVCAGFFSLFGLEG